MKKLVLVFIIGSMILNRCGAKEESENTLDQNLQIESENISNAETEKSNTESITVEEEKVELEQDGDINEKARTYYYEKLTEFFKDGSWPEGRESGWAENEWSQYEYWKDYEYAIADVDLDGIDELLLACKGGDMPMAGW